MTPGRIRSTKFRDSRRARGIVSMTHWVHPDLRAAFLAARKANSDEQLTALLRAAAESESSSEQA